MKAIKLKLKKMRAFYILSFFLYIGITLCILFVKMDFLGKEVQNIIFTGYWIGFLLVEFPDLLDKYPYDEKMLYNKRKIRFNIAVLMIVFISTMMIMIIK